MVSVSGIDWRRPCLGDSNTPFTSTYWTDTCAGVRGCLTSDVGPGRFSIDIAKANAKVTLVDISEKQLELAETRLSEASLAQQVEGYYRLDVTSLSPFDDETFDLTVCYGSVVSYVREHYPSALAELARVTRVGGTVLVSVTSLYGTMRLVGTLDAVSFADSVSDHIDWPALLGGKDVVMTKVDSREFHQPMALFSSKGLCSALEQAGLELIELATSNPTVAMGCRIPNVSESAAAEASLTQLEIALCQKPGLIDSGEHLIAAASRT